MGESTCVMQPFSYVSSGISNEAQEGNPLNALTQSVSFGRFMSESLSWEKWSTFSHKKYVEEAERYSRPGSVAETKAFFEAHYKKIAERKVAALLEQANANANAASNDGCESDHKPSGNDTKTQDSKMLSLNCQVVDDEKQQEAVEALDVKKGVAARPKGNKVEGSEFVNEHKALEVEKEEADVLKKSLIEKGVKDMEINGTTQKEEPLIESSSTSQDDKVSVNKKKSPLSFSKLPFSPARPKAIVHSNKENNATLINKPHSAMDPSHRKKATPKTTNKSMYSTPVREINRLASIFRKIDSSKVGSISKASKDCSIPLKTPTMESKNRTLRHALATPLSESRRAETTLEPPTVGPKTARAKWSFLPADFSKLLSPCRNKSSQSSPKWSTPFRFRTEERAARRKKKLEEKFNADQSQKAQQQTTLKEKAETELRKLGQSFCFKARPLPEFYKERANQAKKVPSAQPQLVTPGRNPTPGKARSKPSLRKASTQSHKSKPVENAHENTSPNIRHE